MGENEELPQRISAGPATIAGEFRELL